MSWLSEAERQQLMKKLEGVTERVQARKRILEWYRRPNRGKAKNIMATRPYTRRPEHLRVEP